VISLDLARRLRDAGLAWKPVPGDRFAIPDRDLDDDVFVLSHMMIDVHERPEGTRIGFNGTTEWALDDLEKDEAIWLPREDQLRELLGGAFQSLARDAGTYRVVTAFGGFDGASPEEAYGTALLHLVRAATT
jgi:hypothetical protein